MTTTADELREEVRRRYAESARAVTEGNGQAGCGGGSCCESDAARFGEALYDAEQRGELPQAATLASLGCGNPTAVADLREGETVLDLGSGGGHRRDPLGETRRTDRCRLRARHDRRDARARAQKRHGCRRRERALPQGHDRGDPAARGLGRRRDLELRDQPLGRQAGRADRDRSRAQAGRTHRDQRRRRRGST